MILELIIYLQLIGQAAKFKFEFKLKPITVFWQSFQKAVPEDSQSLRGFDCKINGRALGAALLSTRRSLGR